MSFLKVGKAGSEMEVDMLKRIDSVVRETGFFNFHGISSALEVVLESHSQVKKLVLSSSNSNFFVKDGELLSVLLNQMTHMLEFCNVIKHGMARMEQMVLSFKYQLASMTPPVGASYSVDQLRKMKQSLEDCLVGVNVDVLEEGPASQKHTANFPLREISSLSHAKNTRKARFARQVYQYNVISAVVLGSLLHAFPCKQSATTPPASCWFSAAGVQFHQDISEELKQLHDRKGGILLQGVYSCMGRALAIVDSLLVPSEESVGDEEPLKVALHQTRKQLFNLENSMELIHEQVTNVFRELITTKSIVLNLFVLK